MPTSSQAKVIVGGEQHQCGGNEQQTPPADAAFTCRCPNHQVMLQVPGDRHASVRTPFPLKAYQPATHLHVVNIQSGVVSYPPKSRNTANLHQPQARGRCQRCDVNEKEKDHRDNYELSPDRVLGTQYWLREKLGLGSFKGSPRDLVKGRADYSSGRYSTSSSSTSPGRDSPSRDTAVIDTVTADLNRLSQEYRTQQYNTSSLKTPASASQLDEMYTDLHPSTDPDPSSHFEKRLCGRLARQNKSQSTPEVNRKRNTTPDRKKISKTNVLYPNRSPNHNKIATNLNVKNLTLNVGDGKANPFFNVSAFQTSSLGAVDSRGGFHRDQHSGSHQPQQEAQLAPDFQEHRHDTLPSVNQPSYCCDQVCQSCLGYTVAERRQFISEYLGFKAHGPSYYRPVTMKECQFPGESAKLGLPGPLGLHRKSRNALMNVSNNWPNDNDDKLPPIADGKRQKKTSVAQSPSANVDIHKKNKMSKNSSIASQAASPPSHAPSRKNSTGPHQHVRKHSCTAGTRSGDEDVETSGQKPGISRVASITTRRGSDTSRKILSQENSQEKDPDTGLRFEVELTKNDDNAEDKEDDDATCVDTGIQGKPDVKALYKQLVMLSLSSNVFRAFQVKTQTGENKMGQEEMEKKAFRKMTTKFVEEQHGMKEEDWDEEEGGEMSLVMGSLFGGMGGGVEFNDDDDDDGGGTAAAINLPPPKHMSADTKKPTAPEPAPKKPAKLADTHWESQEKQKVLDSLPQNVLDLMNEPEEPKKVLSPLRGGKTREEQDAEKALLDQVATGKAFATSKSQMDKIEAQREAQRAKEEAAEARKRRKVFKIPPIRLRHDLPRCDPDLLCIRTPNCDLTHEQAKNMLEAQVGNLRSLQHDPAYLQCGDLQLSPMVMWIFKPEDLTTTNIGRITLEGIIGYDGEKLRVRRRDDVFMEEYQAYMLVRQIQEEHRKTANRVKVVGKK